MKTEFGTKLKKKNFRTLKELFRIYLTNLFY